MKILRWKAKNREFTEVILIEYEVFDGFRGEKSRTKLAKRLKRCVYKTQKKQKDEIICVISRSD